MIGARSLALSLVGAVGITTLSAGRPVAQSGDAAIVSLLESIRQEQRLPALGAAVVTSRGVLVSGVTGVRKAGTTPLATIDDLWHLGSNTKAMTATVVATLVESGALTWETTLGQVFPERAASFRPDFRAITVAQLLSHYAGLPRNLDAFGSIARSGRSLTEQRLNVVTRAASGKLLSVPGTTLLYSNLGYTLAGAIIERVTGQPWEAGTRDRLFTLLGMANCGFGGVGTPGIVDQPWPHEENGRPMPRNGPTVDNPPVIGPAGTVHCSIASWSRFITDHLRGARGERALLKADTYQALHTPRFDAVSAFGWGVSSRSVGGGTAFTHNGNNGMNASLVLIAPSRDLAVLAVTNQGDDRATAGINAAIDALILRYARP